MYTAGTVYVTHNRPASFENAKINRVPKYGRTTRYGNTHVGDSNFTFLQLSAALMEVISCDAIFTGNRTEVPKSCSIAFTLGHRGHRI